MSLPKRDGVHDRYYLIHKPDTSPELLAEADLCIQDVLNGTARENHSAYPTVVRNHNGTPFLPNQLLERYLSKLPLKGFPYEEAVTFCDALRRLVGWQEIRYTLEKYIEKQVQERYFETGEKEDDFTPYPPCTVWPELRPEDVDEGLLGFLFYNHYPAKVFMGDTGSLFLGGAVAALAFAYDMPLILLLVGFVYLCETLSDIIQVTYFKLTHGKRIFKMAPLHHHFEMCGWKETKVVAVFAAVSTIFCVLAYLGVMDRFGA